MSRVFVKGWGAVSPAGWGTAALIQALDGGIPLPPSELARPGWQKALRVRCVPKPQARPTFLSHPRLRRSSPMAGVIESWRLWDRMALRWCSRTRRCG